MFWMKNKSIILFCVSFRSLKKSFRDLFWAQNPIDCQIYFINSILIIAQSILKIIVIVQNFDVQHHFYCRSKLQQFLRRKMPSFIVGFKFFPIHIGRLQRRCVFVILFGFGNQQLLLVANFAIFATFFLGSNYRF